MSGMVRSKAEAGVSVRREGGQWVLEAEQWLPRPREALFPFFAEARNLERITPPWLKFRVLTEGPIEMGEGALIEYRLRLHGVPVRWRTRIAVWEPPARFVDEQLAGPYRRWWHEHVFEPAAGGTRMVDRVRYVVPGGLAAPLVERWFVRRDVVAIFGYRRRVLEELFGGEGEGEVEGAGSGQGSGASLRSALGLSRDATDASGWGGGARSDG